MAPIKFDRCVNCAIKLKRTIKRLMNEESENMRQLVTEWTCKELEDNDAVCGNCHFILQQRLTNNDSTRAFGYKNICLPCGFSLYRLRSRDLTNYPEEKLIVAQWIPPHQVKRLTRICWACWQRASHVIRKRNKVHHNNTEIKIEYDDPLAEDEVYAPTSLPDPADIKQEIEVPAATSISMITYRRASNTSSRCMFKNCKQNERLTVPRLLKERLLIEYSFYIPSHARVCHEHLNNTHNRWGELFDNSNNTDFNTAQLEDLCSLYKSSANRYYSNDTFQSLIKRNSVLCKYWFGVDYEQFEAMLKTLAPVIETLKFPKKSLSMYLMKRHTGFEDEKIASFFKISTSLMQKSISILHRYLKKYDNLVSCEEVNYFNCKEEVNSLQDKEVDPADNIKRDVIEFNVL